VEEQVASLWAGTRGHLDRVPAADIRRFEADFLQYLRHLPSGPLEAIRTEQKLSDEIESGLQEALDVVAQSFTTSDGTLLGREAEAKPMDEAEVGQEKVQVRRAAPPKK
jgi:F-type H+-transporting ATPase subunit alpha